MTVDYVRFIADLAERYYQKAQEKKLLCTASLDEVRMAYMGVAEAHRQGIDDYETIRKIVMSALVKDPECVQPFEDAWTEMISEVSRK